eukprot:2271507-Rhodomonas_salina.4
MKVLREEDAEHLREVDGKAVSRSVREGGAVRRGLRFAGASEALLDAGCSSAEAKSAEAKSAEAKSAEAK